MAHLAKHVASLRFTTCGVIILCSIIEQDALSTAMY